MRRRNIGLSLEDLDPVVDESAPTIEAVSETLDDNGAEMEAAHSDLTEQSEVIDQALSTSDTLTSVSEKVGETLPEGGMGENEAEALKVAVEALCATVGFPRTVIKKTFPAMESFGDSSSKLYATKVAMEGIADRAKEIGGKIIDAIKKMISYIVAFFKQVFDKAARLEATSAKIVKIAEAKKDQTFDDDAKVKVPPILAMDGKYLEPRSFAYQVQQHVKNDFIVKDYAATLKSVVANADETFSFANGWGSFMDDFKRGGVKDGENGGKVYSVRLGFGMQDLDAHLDAPDASGGSPIGDKSTSRIEVKMNDKYKDVAPAEVGAMKPQEVKAAAEAIQFHLHRVYTDAKKEMAEAEKAANDLIAKIGKIAKDNDAEKEADASTQRKVQSALNLTLGAAAALRRYDLSVCGAALGYCAGSLKTLSTTS